MQGARRSLVHSKPHPNAHRLPLVDGTRFLSAFAVIWIHTAENPRSLFWVPLCWIGVPFFVVSMISFNVKHVLGTSPPQTWTAYALMRFHRLYVPFLLWSLIYLGFRQLKHCFVPGSASIALSPATLLTGTAHHLWFLPMAFILSLSLYPISRGLALCRPPMVALWSVLFLATGVLIGLSSCPLAMDATGNPISYFAGMSWAALPAAFFSLALAPWLRDQPSTWMVLSGLATLTLTAWLLLFTHGHPLLPSIGGVALWVTAHARIPQRIAPIFIKAGSLSFGIYLIHISFVEGFQTLATRIGVQTTVSLDLSITLAALVSSAICCLLLQPVRSLTILFPR